MPAFLAPLLAWGTRLVTQFPKIAKAGAWLKNALWGSNFAKGTTVFSGLHMLNGATKAKATAATGSQAAQHLARYRGATV